MNKFLLAVLAAILLAAVVFSMPASADQQSKVIAPHAQESNVVDVILPAAELPPGATVLDRYDAIGYVHALVPTTNQKALALLAVNESSQGLITIKDNWELNEPKFHALLNDSVPLINANVTKSLGFNGSNATVCILDTGIDYFHPNLPTPNATTAKDFTTKDWCIEPDLACPIAFGSPCNTSANPTSIGRQLKYRLNISNTTAVNVTDWIEIGAAWKLDGNRFDISVYYPNGTLANSSAAQNVTNYTAGGFTECGLSICYFNIVNVTINNTFGVYTVVWNDTNVTNPNWASTLLWGANVTYLYDWYSWGNCNLGHFGTPIDYNESRTFYNIDPQDDNIRGSTNNAPGHGTHVAGTIASNDTTYAGVAPGTKLLIGKVLYTDGGGYTSDVDAGIQWCIDNGADIISMSLGGGASPNCNSSTDQLIDTAAKSGILSVIAAGNSGPGSQTIGSPGCARGALTVGATNKTDVIASFSSRGTTLDGRLKPEITAPGVSIKSTAITAAFGILSGTSQATPHVSGLAAVLKSLNRSWTPAMIKAAIINSANQSQISGYDNTYGFGRVDFLEAANNTNVTNNSIAENTNLTYTFNVTNKTSFTATIDWLENSTDTHSKIYLYLKAPNGTIVSSSINDNNTVQKVSTTNPENGNWSVVVQGVDINSVGDFSLAYTSTSLLSTTLTKANGVSCSSASECAGGYCVHSICRSAITYCGDNYCDSGEDSSTCVTDCPVTSSGGSGGGEGLHNTFLLAAAIGQSEDFELIRGDRIEFDIANVTHKVRLSGILGDKREFTITSTPATVTLGVGQTAELDLNNNGIKDFSITLLEITKDGAVVSVKLLQEILTPTAPAETNVTNITGNKTEEVPAAQQGTTGEKGKNELLLIGISIVVAIIIYALLGTGKKKRRGKLGRRKRLWMSEYDDD